jgi:hypothetical protein
MPFDIRLATIGGDSRPFEIDLARSVEKQLKGLKPGLSKAFGTTTVRCQPVLGGDSMCQWPVRHILRVDYLAQNRRSLILYGARAVHNGRITDSHREALSIKCGRLSRYPR